MFRFLLVDLALWETPRRIGLPTFDKQTLHAKSGSGSNPDQTPAHLIPRFVQHYSATYRNPGLVCQKALESLFVIVTPVAEEGANMEKAV